MESKKFLIGDVLMLASKENNAEYLVIGYSGYRPICIGTSKNQVNQKMPGLVRHLNDSDYCPTGKNYDISNFVEIVNNLISE